MNLDEKWMKIAINEASLAMQKNEIPVGAVLVKNNKLIAQSHNQPIQNNDPTAHAEIEVLRKAGAKLLNYRLPKTTLYVTLEPCSMCLGAMVHARIERVVFGASDLKNGICGSYTELASESFFNHKIEISRGVLERECKEIIQKFFKLKRLE
jgi:tRNA(adenine34) deaminase